MSKFLICAVAWAAVVSCGDKKKPDNAPDKGSAHASAGSAGSATTAPVASGSDLLGQGSGMEGSAATNLPITPDARANQYDACWKLWDDGRFDAYGNCYALDAKSEAPGGNQPAATSRATIVEQAKSSRKEVPDQKGAIQLELATGSTVIAIVLVTGTYGGKATGAYAGIVTDFNDKGDIVHEQAYLDPDTIIGQATGSAGVRPVIAQATPRERFIAKGDNNEKTNEALVQKLIYAFGQHDANAFGALLADNLVWSDATQAADDDKPKLLASMKKMWGEIAGARIDAPVLWAAGDYVAVQETLDGTVKGKPFSVPALAVYRLSAGAIAQAWLFYQRGAMKTAEGKP